MDGFKAYADGCHAPDGDLIMFFMESASLSLDLVRDDESLVLTDLKPLSNQLGSGLMVYHRP